ncbi:MAG: M48 family metallopeptidase [Acidobacteriota bacterium]|nr:M48 family metallopeptidase [Thermoanaerobaculaceae bacterium]
MADHKIRKQLLLNNQKITYTVIRNNRAYKIWLRIDEEDGLVVVLPKGRKITGIPKIIRKHKEWVLTALQKREERLKNAPPPLGSSKIVVYRGRKVDLKIKNVACPKPKVKLENNSINVIMPKDSDLSVKEVLSDWLKERALLFFSRRVEYFAGKLGLKFGCICVRDQKTRWGSCSSKGALSFNWRLLFAPPEILDYVVVHEVCHLKYHDHSNRFWHLVSSIFPNYQKSRMWLKENGLTLKA